MQPPSDPRQRRRVLRRLAQTLLLPPLSAAWPTRAAETLRETPGCGLRHHNTPPQTEGPYFKRESPQRDSLLEPGATGTHLLLTGRVLTTECRLVPAALLDFWQADAEGRYDNDGFRLRGHQFTDAEGRYRLETIVPANYAGRTRHLHLKAQAPGGRVLTTQLYFPNEPGNERDRLYEPELLMSVQRAADGLVATFDVVLPKP